MFDFLISLCFLLLVVKCTADDICRPTDDGKIVNGCDKIFVDKKTKELENINNELKSNLDTLRNDLDTCEGRK